MSPSAGELTAHQCAMYSCPSSRQLAQQLTRCLASVAAAGLASAAHAWPRVEQVFQVSVLRMPGTACMLWTGQVHPPGNATHVQQHWWQRGERTRSTRQPRACSSLHSSRLLTSSTLPDRISSPTITRVAVRVSEASVEACTGRHHSAGCVPVPADTKCNACTVPEDAPDGPDYVAAPRQSILHAAASPRACAGGMAHAAEGDVRAQVSCAGECSRWSAPAAYPAGEAILASAPCPLQTSICQQVCGGVASVLLPQHAARHKFLRVSRKVCRAVAAGHITSSAAPSTAD